MKNEIATTSNQLEKVTDTELLNHLENLGLIKELSTGEKNTYLQICKAYNLNPFKREVHVSKYNGQMSIITGYETYIKRAERSGVLDGWEVKTEGEGVNLKAIITIWRKDRTKPFVWEVKYSEYVQKTKEGAVNKFWQKAETMTKKVAMAQGFRLCFNDELGGMPYTSEEMPEIKTEDVAHEELKNIGPELDAAIQAIEDATTKKDLTDLKKKLPAYIVSDASFIAAGKKKYDLIMAAPPVAPVENPVA